MNDPRISVITATYNRADVLRRAVESVRSQTVKPFEYIIVDDGSTDDTSQLLSQYDDSWITTIALNKNCGPATAWNRAIEQVNTAYTTFLDSDDEYLPHRLERTIEILDKHPNTGGIAHTFEKVRNKKRTHRPVPDCRLTHKRLVNRNLIGGTSNTAYRTAAIRDVGGFDESFQSSIDYELQLRLTEASDLIGIDEVLCRKYDDRPDRIQRTPERIIAGLERLIDKHSSNLTQHNIAKRRVRIGTAHLRLGQESEARDQFDQAITITPTENQAEIHHRIGIYLLEHNETSHARSHLSRAIRHEPWRYKSWISAAVSLAPVDRKRTLAELRTIRDRVTQTNRSQ